jgi:lipid-A-disaccharide synthase
MKLVIIAGEVSGDIHGARLVRSLISRNDSIGLSGIGGDLMVKEGLNAIYHINQMAFLGLTEVIKHLPFIQRVFKDITQHIASTKPDAVILIDYPGFNLRLAKKIKKMGIPVIYYISPQLWAWGKRRVKKIRNFVDQMLVVFPFEVDFYHKYGIEAIYVGHPLVDSHFGQVQPKEYNSYDRVLGLLPGSRRQELDKLLPDMISTAEILHNDNKLDRVLIARVNNIPRSEYDKYLQGKDYIEIYEGAIDQFYNQLDAALVSSGTATLETAYFQVPLVIVYRVGKITWQLGKRLVKLEGIGLANIVAGKTIAKELLQNDFTPENAVREISGLLNQQENEEKRMELKIISQKLGQPGASDRAADYIIKFVEER